MADEDGRIGAGGVVFTNVRVLDGSGDYPFTGEVVVQGNRIKQVTKGSSRLSSTSGMGGQTVIDGMGATLMPGMTEAHLHLSWNNAPGIDPIQMMPPEEHTLVTAQMAKVVLDAGFTSGRGAAAAKPRLDVVVRNAINRGMIPGPRYLAAGPDITTVRTLLKYGVDTIKLNLSGEEITGMKAEETPMSEEEIAVAVHEAKIRNRGLAAHARSSGSIKQCIKYGISVIYHASFADEEALDLLEANKDKHFVAPGLAWLIGVARNAGEWGIKPGTRMTIAYERELEHAIETCKKMHRRGIRVLIGGDYGFAWTPQGTNAKDLEYFVDMLGFSPMEAILAATKYGGQIMNQGDELGMIKPGYLADMLLVDGDPISNIRVLQDKSRLLAIMKDGQFHKAPRMNEQRRRLSA